MLKITQNKLAKSSKPQSAAPPQMLDDASFLKKLSRQNEMNQTGAAQPQPAPHMMVNTL